MGGGLDTTSGAREEATVRAGGSGARALRPARRPRRWGLGATEDEDEEEEKVEMAAGATILYGPAVAAEREGRGRGAGEM